MPKFVIGFFIGAIIVMVATIFVLILSNGQPPILGSCMILPEGYEYSGIAQKWSGEYTYDDVMVCRNLETGDYRECMPEFVECE